MRPRLLLRDLGQAFVSGLLMLAPLAATVFVFVLLWQWVGGTARALVLGWVPEEARPNTGPVGEVVLTLASVLLLALVVTLVGFLSRFFIGQAAVNLLDALVRRVPILRDVYGTFKQFADAFGPSRQSVFDRPVLVEFPQPGQWAVAFRTGGATGCLPEGFATVYIPLAPNPTTGHVLIVREAALRPLDLSPGDAMKVVVSAGAVCPGPVRPDA